MAQRYVPDAWHIRDGGFLADKATLLCDAAMVESQRSGARRAAHRLPGTARTAFERVGMRGSAMSYQSMPLVNAEWCSSSENAPSTSFKEAKTNTWLRTMCLRVRTSTNVYLAGDLGFNNSDQRLMGGEACERHRLCGDDSCPPV